jgi:hypothetical protein
VGAARDEGDVLTGPGEFRPEVTADGARSQDRESHTA